MSERSNERSAMRALAEASAWRVRLTEAGLESSLEFEAWIAADPAHEAAWAQVQAPWAEIGAHATSPELMRRRRDALARAHDRTRRRWRGDLVTRRRAIAASAAALLALSGAYGVLHWRAGGAEIYRTALGERRVVPLPDGSRVSLDSDSEVRVRYRADARQLVLRRGQARFDVAHDTQRPFSVQARDQVVVATGTAFNIDLLGPQLLVTLIEGSVVITPDAPATATHTPVLLAAGQQMIARAAETPRVQTVRVDRATAWESGQLMFEDEALGAVAERVSRYARSPIAVDATARGLRISGVFKAGDVATFVDTVTRYLPVVATTRADGTVTLRARS